MLLATELKRVFIMTNEQGEVILTDPEPNWSVGAVMNYYTRSYPILTTAKISEPIINNDTIQYRFESIMGTKG